MLRHIQELGDLAFNDAVLTVQWLEFADPQ